MTAHAPIHVFRWNERELEEWTPETLDGLREKVEEKRVLWINVNGAKDPDIARVLERDFGIHPLTVEDVANYEQRPKVEDYHDYLYVVSRMVKEDADGELDTEQVSFILGRGWLITLQEGKPGDVFEGVRHRIRSGRPRIRKLGTDYLLYALLDAIVDAYFPRLEKLGNRAEELEDEILEHDSENVRERLQGLRRDLLTLRRVAWPQRDALGPLERGESKWIAPGTRTYLRDVSDHISRVIDFVETNRELVSNLMDLHLANVAQKTTEVMKVLTVVATIFIPLTFVVGVYGMNFDYMPELQVWWAYPLLWVILIGLGGGMFLSFKKRGWV